MRFIQNETFSNNKLPSLSNLDLSANQIKLITSGLFNNMIIKMNLNLKSNKIELIQTKAFYNISFNLLKLDLNPVSIIETRAFYFINFNPNMVLNNLNLTRMYEAAFSNVIANTLLLSGNRINYLKII